MIERTFAVSEASFKADVLEAQVPVLVDFWAQWCDACLRVGPMLDEIAAEMECKLTIAAVNIDECPTLRSTYAGIGIPTLILFKCGKPVHTRLGALPKDELRAWVQRALA